MRLLPRHRGRLAAALLVAFLLSQTAAIGHPQSVAAADPTCGVPRLVAAIDPGRSSAMSPHIDAHWDGLGAPAQARISWGNGEYQTAAVDLRQGATRPVAVDPRYGQPGEYVVTFEITDECGSTHTETLTVAVPLAAEPASRITCPGIEDQSGYCVVGLAEPLSLDVSGAPPSADGWTWRIAPVTDGAMSPGPGDGATLTLHDARARVVQATSPSDAGWLVTRPLTLVAQPRRPGPITRFAAPGTAVAGEDVILDFDVPQGPADARPYITLDDGPRHEARSMTTRLPAGTHTVTYTAVYPDGSVVERQTIVVARAQAPVAALIVSAAGAAGLLVLLALVVRRRRRRTDGGRLPGPNDDRAAPPPPSPMPISRSSSRDIATAAPSIPVGRSEEWTVLATWAALLVALAASLLVIERRVR